MKKLKMPTALRRKTPGKMPPQKVQNVGASAPSHSAEPTPSSPFKSSTAMAANDAARCCSHYLISRSKRRRMTR